MMKAFQKQEEEREARGETGFYVVPNMNCGHVESIVPPSTADPNSSCERCGHVGENWLCLSCSKVFCSRYINGHMIEHGKETGHELVLSFADLSVWCYGCDSYVKHRNLIQILQDVHNRKFDTEMRGVENDQQMTGGDSTNTTTPTTTTTTTTSKNGSLDGGGGGFYVSPITNCPHIEELKEVPKTGNTNDACMSCGNVGENWLCLTCSKVFCSRYVNGDMATHCGKEGHSVVASFSDFSCWCYQCDSYISNPKLFDLLTNLHVSKFGFAPRTRTSDDSNSNSNSTIITTPPKPGRGFNGAPTTVEELEELHDDKEELLRKVKQVAEMIKKSSHFVAYTGAGISTSANLPDYRGPNGVWTVASQGRILPPGITLEQALPTAAHMALKVLQDHGLLKFLVSTNVDGLHRRSGIKEENLAELHGNIYREKCEKCNKEYLRPFDTTKSQFGLTRKTGRKCSSLSCGGDLRDTIINFGENLPLEALEKSYNHSSQADVRLVLGTSMRVSPAKSSSVGRIKIF